MTDLVDLLAKKRRLMRHLASVCAHGHPSGDQMCVGTRNWTWPYVPGGCLGKMLSERAALNRLILSARRSVRP